MMRKRKREKGQKRAQKDEVSFLSQTESAFLQILPLFSLLSSNFLFRTEKDKGAKFPFY